MPGWLELQLPELFRLFPDGSLWLVSVEPVLLARLTIVGGGFQLAATPDFPLDPNNPAGFDALDEHSLTRGVAFGKALDPVLLAFSPGVVGYAFDRQPHALVLLFGYDAELREVPPRSLSSAYEPTIFEPLREEPWDDPDFRENLAASDIEALFEWWVSRLNVFYSRAADPTRFVNGDGIHDPLAQQAWFLTFERMLADATLILAAPQLAALARLTAAFDFLEATSRQVVYEAERVILARVLCGCRDGDHLLGLVDGVGERFRDRLGARVAAGDLPFVVLPGDPARRRAVDRTERRMARRPPLPLRRIVRARPRR